MTLLFAAQPTLAARPQKTLMLIGDSLSAGYGVPAGTEWPALLAARLKEQRLDYSVANLSVSGETSAGGLNRLTAALQRHRPAVVVIELGANDGLQGLPLTALRQNLHAMVDAAKQAGARVLLVGMRLPPNYGNYAREFDAVFAEVARTAKLPVPPFLLDGIGDQATFFQTDRLHPNAAAQSRLLDNIWPALLPLLK